MNNRSLALTFIFALCFFSLQGCGNSAPDTSEIIKNTSSQEKRIGSIQSLGGAYTSTGATHLLKMDDGTNLHLKSQKVSLDNEKYREKQIEVMGEITRTRDGNQIMEVMSIDILEQENTDMDNVPLWTDYSSNKMGISFKYRDDYLVRENDLITVERHPSKATDNNVLTDPTTEEVTSTVPSQMMLELVSPDLEIMAELMGVESMESSDILAGGFTRSKITQKGLDAYKISPSPEETIYWMSNENGVYKFQYRLAENENNKAEFQNMFFDILASMEFSGSQLTEVDATPAPDVNFPTTGEDTLDSAEENTLINESLDADEPDTDEIMQTTTFEEISGFTTFQSESAGFSVQYPKSYYFGPNENKASDAIRSYQFGTTPLEEGPGDVIFEMINSSVPDGQKQSFNGTSMTRVIQGDQATFYAELNGKTYRITGPSQRETIMKQMLSTVR